MKFVPGDKVFCKKYGKGFVHKIDETEKDWFYDFHFADGTRIWMSKADGERYVKHRKKPEIVFAPIVE